MRGLLIGALVIVSLAIGDLARLWAEATVTPWTGLAARELLAFVVGIIATFAMLEEPRV